jgi:hypothetical protein
MLLVTRALMTDRGWDRMMGAMYPKPKPEQR